MKLEHWMQLIFGTVILSGLGFLVTNLFDMKGTLSSVSTRVDTTDQRLTRIADTLPEVKARVAWEEINKPIAGFVVATVPKETENGKWESSVKLYDAKSGKLQTYSLAVETNQKDLLTFAIAGKIRAESAYDPTFAELASYSVTEKETVSIPATVNPNTSFVLRQADISKYSSYLKQVTAQDPTVKDLGLLRNWKEVAEKLDHAK